MPAPRKDAEAGTDKAATGNVESNAVLLSDLAATQELVMRQEDMIQRLADQVAKLSQTAEGDAPPPAPTGPPPLAEGHKRYAARFTDLTMVKEAGRRIYVDGQGVVFEPATHIDFVGGVYETGDPNVIEWLDNHPELNTVFWEDPTATRAQGVVQVMPGVRASEETPRAPLMAPMS